MSRHSITCFHLDTSDSCTFSRHVVAPASGALPYCLQVCVSQSHRRSKYLFLSPSDSSRPSHVRGLAAALLRSLTRLNHSNYRFPLRHIELAAMTLAMVSPALKIGGPGRCCCHRPRPPLFVLLFHDSILSLAPCPVDTPPGPSISRHKLLFDLLLCLRCLGCHGCSFVLILFEPVLMRYRLGCHCVAGRDGGLACVLLKEETFIKCRA